MNNLKGKHTFDPGHLTNSRAPFTAVSEFLDATVAVLSQFCESKRLTEGLELMSVLSLSC